MLLPGATEHARPRRDVEAATSGIVEPERIPCDPAVFRGNLRKHSPTGDLCSLECQCGFPCSMDRRPGSHARGHFPVLGAVAAGWTNQETPRQLDRGRSLAWRHWRAHRVSSEEELYCHAVISVRYLPRFAKRRDL